MKKAKAEALSAKWKPGQSGNPAGKPKGCRNRATLIAQTVMEDGAKEIAEKVVAAAKAGDMSACRLVLERLVPPAKERPVSVSLPDITTADGIAQAQALILDAAARGDILPGEAATLAGIVEARRKAMETEELERRIAALEAKK